MSQTARSMHAQVDLTRDAEGLEHLARGERSIALVQDVPADTPVLPIASAAVVGAGTMGAGIAMTLVEAGIPVLLKETAQDALDRGLATIRSLYEHQATTGKIKPDAIAQRLALLTPTLSYESFAAVDIVYRSSLRRHGPSNRKSSAKLDRVCRPGRNPRKQYPPTPRHRPDRLRCPTRPESVRRARTSSLPPNVIRLLENRARSRPRPRTVLATCMQLAKTARQAGRGRGQLQRFSSQIAWFLPYHRQAEFPGRRWRARPRSSTRR